MENFRSSVWCYTVVTRERELNDVLARAVKTFCSP